MGVLTRDDILSAWKRLGELAHAGGRSIELLVVGGAVMTVHFRSRASTQDVDALLDPAPETRAWARIVAEENGWPDDWLNDGAKGYVTLKSVGPLLHESQGIVVRSVALAHMLALKLMAWRDDVDFRDGIQIFRALRDDPTVDVSSAAKVYELVEPYVISQYALKTRYGVDEVLELETDESYRTNSPPDSG